MEINQLQLQSSSPDAPGDLGFKLVGSGKKDSNRRVRVWVRRKKGAGRQVWTRYLAPEATSNTWEVRLFERKTTGAMTFTPYNEATLKRFAKEYAFPQTPEHLDALKAVEIDDPLFHEIRTWAIEQMGG